MTIDINKRMMEKHSETVKQAEADKALVRARREVEPTRREASWKSQRLQGAPETP